MTCTKDRRSASASFVSRMICSDSWRPFSGAADCADLEPKRATVARRVSAMVEAPPATERSMRAVARPVSLTMDENRPFLLLSSSLGAAYSAARPWSMTCSACEPLNNVSLDQCRSHSPTIVQTQAGGA